MNKKLVVFLLCTLFLLSACVTQGSLRKDRIDMTTQCIEEGFKKGTVLHAKCINNKIEQRMIEINYAYFDLFDLSAAYRVYLAEKIENQEISESEAELLWASFKVKYSTEEQKRSIDTTYARAAAAKGNAALMQSWGIMLESLQPKQPSFNTSTCIQQGVFTNCTY